MDQAVIQIKATLAAAIFPESKAGSGLSISMAGASVNSMQVIWTHQSFLPQQPGVGSSRHSVLPPAAVSVAEAVSGLRCLR